MLVGYQNQEFKNIAFTEDSGYKSSSVQGLYPQTASTSVKKHDKKSSRTCEFSQTFTYIKYILKDYEMEENILEYH